MKFQWTWWHHQMETFSVLLTLCAGNHRSLVNSPHKGQWRGALMFSLICAWINAWVNNHEARDLRRHHAHYDVIRMVLHHGKWQAQGSPLGKTQLLETIIPFIYLFMYSSFIYLFINTFIYLPDDDMRWGGNIRQWPEAYHTLHNDHLITS